MYAAYASYLARFVESYCAEGIDVSMVVPQNEPGQLTRYPSCGWTPAQYVTFIRDHLGPTFQRRSLPTQIYSRERACSPPAAPSPIRSRF